MATRINLLPWREARRAQQQKEFLSMLFVGVLIAAAGVVGFHMFIGAKIEHQEARNQYLQDEITRLSEIEKEIEAMERDKERLLGRLEAIQNLQRSRPIMVQIFDTLARRQPGEIFLQDLQSEGNRLVIKGTAQSNLIVSDYMRQLAEVPLLQEPELQVIENEEINGVRASRFDILVQRTPLTAPEDDEGASS